MAKIIIHCRNVVFVMFQWFKCYSCVGYVICL